ncbi:MAG: FmdE, Molybdenum formylmethanofuran dehydrogenase operon [Methanosaeta sp. PtaB.Bin087]|nr:MAG: FmdE, Molybdenum formylmethanofuran dehydrogenase operon [Methanosaeta sp. PtaB.Bin087]
MDMKGLEEGGDDLEEAINKAVEFHGHLGPFLVLGVRMGLLARRELDSAPGEMVAVVKTGAVPSLSCLLDGIQVSAGCTLGRGNISTGPLGIAEAEFSARGRMVTIRARDEVVGEIRSWRERYASLEEVARSISKRSDEELFEPSWL